MPLFVTNNKLKFMTNSENYYIHTTHRKDLHLHHTNLATYQKEFIFSGVQIFKNLLLDIINTEGNL